MDDDKFHRTALSRLLKTAGYDVQPYESAEEFLDTLVDHPSGCLLLDLDLPGSTGLQLQEKLHREGNRIPIVFLTGKGDIPSSVRAIKAGAIDFLTKPVRKESLLPAVRAALERQQLLNQTKVDDSTVRSLFESLSEREKEVFRLLVNGLLNKQAAAELDITERTIKAHRAQIMAKMHATSFADLVRMAAFLT